VLPWCWRLLLTLLCCVLLFCVLLACRMRDYVSLIQDCLHILEDTTMYVPAALAKAAYAPGDMLRRKVRQHQPMLNSFCSL
jgi:hypothetical protein